MAPVVSYGKEKKIVTEASFFFGRSGIKGNAAAQMEIHGFLYSSLSNLSAEGIPLLSARVETKFYFTLHKDFVSRNG